jgi:hypothetical protein
MKLVTTLTAAALLLGAAAVTANAQNQRLGSSGILALKNATPIVQPAACNGRTGSHGCGPGWIWNGRRCVRC